MTLTIKLPPDIEKQVEAAATKRGVQPEEIVLDLVRDKYRPASATNGKSSLQQLARKFHESIPAEAWEGVPKDRSINHDHYLYGAPKVDE
jgi:hypothetical protein